MNAKQIERIIRKDGWILKSQKGSHQQFMHPSKKGKVTIAIHGKREIPSKTLKSIFAQAGLNFKKL
jgi:predicted RNA binding protein YcfA (HicA-like mRNA interferase family)